MQWNYKYLFLTIFSITLLGIIHLPLSFGGDQAFFLLGAKEMKEGLILYRDFWDIKQPGIFVFYLCAGKAFGFTEVGIHAFELCYWLIFSIILLWFLNKTRWFRNEYLIYLAPLAIVGSYYGFSSPSLLTQVEALINLPLLLLIIFNYLFLADKRKKSLWLFCSGITGGLIIFFKMIFAPILIAMLIHLYLHYVSSYKKEGFYKPLLYFCLIPLGVITLWTPFIIYCFKHEIFQICYDTFFNYPLRIIQFAEIRNYDALYVSIKDYFFNLFPIFPFTILSVLFIIRKKFIVVAMWLWLIFAFIVIFLQRTSWFEYHFQIFYTPIIILALFSIDFIINKIEFSKLNLTIKSPLLLKFYILILLNYFLIISTSAKIYNLYKYKFAISETDRRNFILSRSNNEKAYKISQYLINNDDSNCPIFVAYDPLVYYYANRNQATAQKGWCLHLFFPGQLDTLYNELQKKKPRFIFIHKLYEPYFKTKGLKILTWINKNYLVGESSEEGNWYKLTE